MRSPRRLFPLQALAAALLAGTVPGALHGAPAAKPPAAPTLPVTYGPGREIAKLANTAITESSGIACSRSTPGVFWTHNDSGSPPQLHAFNMKGEDLGTWRVQGAEALDWEDMASFTLGGRHHLLIADVGDNTYGDAFEYTRQAAEDWGKAFARPPRQIRMPPRAQGESVCYGPDGVTLYLTSEKLPTPLIEVPPEAR